MKANFIHFWCVESEFVVKNWFHNWTPELVCIWHIFGKLGSFWLFLEKPDIQVTVNITVNKAQPICNSGLLPLLKCLKRAKFSIEWNMPLLSLALFFFTHNEFWTGWTILESKTCWPNPKIRDHNKCVKRTFLGIEILNKNCFIGFFAAPFFLVGHFGIWNGCFRKCWSILCLEYF